MSQKAITDFAMSKIFSILEELANPDTPVSFMARTSDTDETAKLTID